MGGVGSRVDDGNSQSLIRLCYLCFPFEVPPSHTWWCVEQKLIPSPGVVLGV